MSIADLLIVKRYIKEHRWEKVDEIALYKDIGYFTMWAGEY